MGCGVGERVGSVCRVTRRCVGPSQQREKPRTKANQRHGRIAYPHLCVLPPTPLVVPSPASSHRAQNFLTRSRRSHRSLSTSTPLNRSAATPCGSSSCLPAADTPCTAASTPVCQRPHPACRPTLRERTHAALAAFTHPPWSWPPCSNSPSTTSLRARATSRCAHHHRSLR